MITEVLLEKIGHLVLKSEKRDQQLSSAAKPKKSRRQKLASLQLCGAASAPRTRSRKYTEFML